MKNMIYASPVAILITLDGEDIIRTSGEYDAENGLDNVIKADNSWFKIS